MPYIKEIIIDKPTEGAGRFPFNIGIFQNGFSLSLDKEVTVIAGENGSGKSTLLESLAAATNFPRQGGVRGQNMLRQSFGMNNMGEQIEINYDNLELSQSMKIRWGARTDRGYFFRSEYMSETMQGHLNARYLLTQSHGEGILELVRDWRDGLFILDEPESALSPTSLLALAALIYEKAKTFNAQYIIVTHSPILMAIPQSEFHWIGHEKMERMDYKNSPHFSISKAFFDNPHRMINRVIESN